MKFSSYAATDQKSALPPLIDYLNQTPPDAPHIWQEWYVERIFGGHNNLLFHASHPCGEVAVKITRVDERNRAVREFNTLLALQQADLQIAPLPLVLDAENENGRQIVVQSWLEGEVSSASPQTEAEWGLFLDHILLTHNVLPEETAVALSSATLSAIHPNQFLAYLQQFVSKLPTDIQSGPLRGLMSQLEAKRYPQWSDCRRTLIHCDCNPLNFVRRPSGWLSVDWENSGWGDPALEIADIMAHAGMMDVSQERWSWLVEQYCARMGGIDATAVDRIWSYYPLLVTFWVAIFGKGMYDLTHDIPHDRLAPRPSDWAEMIPIKYNHYLSLARSIIG